LAATVDTHGAKGICQRIGQRPSLLNHLTSSFSPITTTQFPGNSFIKLPKKQQITNLTSSDFVISQRNNEAATRLLKIQAAIQKKGPKQNSGPFSHFNALST
jgi:hypothetical protein